MCLATSGTYKKNFFALGEDLEKHILAARFMYKELGINLNEYFKMSPHSRIAIHNFVSKTVDKELEAMKQEIKKG